MSETDCNIRRLLRAFSFSSRFKVAFFLFCRKSPSQHENDERERERERGRVPSRGRARNKTDDCDDADGDCFWDTVLLKKGSGRGLK